MQDNDTSAAVLLPPHCKGKGEDCLEDAVKESDNVKNTSNPTESQQNQEGSEATPVPHSTLLEPGISKVAFIAFLFASMMAIAGLVFLNADQSYIILDILKYPREHVGNATGTLVFADECLSLILLSPLGALSDVCGRRIVFSSGLALMSVAVALYPWATNVFPSSLSHFPTSLLAFRLLFSIGGSASTSMLTAVIGDYSSSLPGGDGARAKVSAIVGFSTGVGALFSAMFLCRIPAMISGKTRSDGIFGKIVDWMGGRDGGASLVISFSVAAAMLFFASITTLIFVTPPPKIRKSSRTIPATCKHAPKATLMSVQRNASPPSSPSPNIIERIGYGLRAAKCPLIALAYASSFVARSDSIALTMFIAPWIDNWMVSQGLCPASAGRGAIVRCKAAKRQTSTLMGCAHLAMLLGAPLFGFINARIRSSLNSLIIPSLLNCISFTLLSLVKDPSDWLIFLAMTMAGLADIGMIIGSMALIASVSSCEHRGALSGVYSMFGAVGIIVTSKIGGWLFDNVGENASFWCVSIASFVLLALCLSIAFHVRAIVRRSA